VHLAAVTLANELKKLGYAVTEESFFDTVKLTHTDNVKIHALAEAALVFPSRMLRNTFHLSYKSRERSHDAIL